MSGPQSVAAIAAGFAVQVQLCLQDFYLGFGGLSPARLILEQLGLGAFPTVFGLPPNGLDLPETVLRLPELSGKEITGQHGYNAPSKAALPCSGRRRGGVPQPAAARVAAPFQLGLQVFGPGFGGFGAARLFLGALRLIPGPLRFLLDPCFGFLGPLRFCARLVLGPLRFCARLVLGTLRFCARLVLGLLHVCARLGFDLLDASGKEIAGQHGCRTSGQGNCRAYYLKDSDPGPGGFAAHYAGVQGWDGVVDGCRYPGGCGLEHNKIYHNQQGSGKVNRQQLAAAIPSL